MKGGLKAAFSISGSQISLKSESSSWNYADLGAFCNAACAL